MLALVFYMLTIKCPECSAGLYMAFSNKDFSGWKACKNCGVPSYVIASGDANYKVKSLHQMIEDLKEKKMVAQALVKKKEKESAKIADKLKIAAYDCKLNKTLGDEMFMNAAFLVDKGREKEFDNMMDDLGDAHKDRVKFMYSGPFAPYNFVNIIIYPKEWEK